MRRLITSLLAAFLFSGVAVYACEFVILIWGIESKSADPLFRFVQRGKAGYIDSSGKIVIKPMLPADSNFRGEFHEGLLAVEERNIYRYVDKSGAVVLRVEAWLPGDFSEGLAATSKDTKSPWGFINRTGAFVIPPQFDSVEPFSEGLARVSVSRQFGTTGYIDHHGTLVIPAHLTKGSDFHEGLAAAIVEGPCRRIPSSSCWAADKFQPMPSTPARNCRFAYIDKTGKPISDLRFDDAMDFSEGLAAVRIGNEWGYIDRTGKLVIPPQFESAAPFSEDLAAVAKEGKTGFIDRAGSFVIPAQFQYAASFSDGRSLVVEGQFRFIDKTGKPAFPGTFDVATSFTYGLAHVALDSHTKAWIDTSGKHIFTYRE